MRAWAPMSWWRRARAEIGPLKLARHGAMLTTIVVMLSAVSNLAGAAAVISETARNPHDFVLKLDYENFVYGNWSGDAEFSLSACPQQTCFHLAGRVELPRSRSVPHINEGAFRIPGSTCDLYMQEVSKRGMDSGDWRIGLLAEDQAGKGCAALPPGLVGVYREVN